MLRGVHGFLLEGAERGEGLLVAMPAENLAVVRAEIGTDLGAIAYTDLGGAESNPARLVSAWHRAWEGSGGIGMRCVGESLWPSRGDAETEECERHELSVNVALGSLPYSVLCPYDRSRLPQEVIERVGHSHPLLQGGGDAAAESPDFAETSGSDLFDGTLAAPATAAQDMDFGRTELADLRAFLRDRLEQSGLPRDRHEDLVLAGDELATNTIRHGGGIGTMQVWEDDDRLYCEVRDDGRIENPLVGRLRPPPDRDGGRGLWLANQLCDLVQIRSGEAGTVVRLSMRLEGGG
jgi:anti-sigma regulatory factor (Ser/Thr protein kinase)